MDGITLSELIVRPPGYGTDVVLELEGRGRDGLGLRARVGSAQFSLDTPPCGNNWPLRAAREALQKCAPSLRR